MDAWEGISKVVRIRDEQRHRILHLITFLEPSPRPIRVGSIVKGSQCRLIYCVLYYFCGKGLVGVVLVDAFSKSVTCIKLAV